MKKPINWHLGVAAILLILAALLGYDMYRLDALSKPDKQSENLTKILLAIGSGIGALYLLVFKHDQELPLLNARSLKEKDNIFTKAAAESYFQEKLAPTLRSLETQAAAVQKYTELALTDEYNRRNERHDLLKSFSEQVIFASREFRKLVGYRPTPGESTETIVNLLAQALAARQLFIAARDQLEPMHIVDAEHKPVIREYASTLINIIIDVRRPGDISAATDETYRERMESNGRRLEDLHDQICAILKVFLAPQTRRGYRPLKNP